MFSLRSRTDKGSWPLARALERIVSRDSFGSAFRRVWFKAIRLLDVVIWLRIPSRDSLAGAILQIWTRRGCVAVSADGSEEALMDHDVWLRHRVAYVMTSCSTYTFLHCD